MYFPFLFEFLEYYRNYSTVSKQTLILIIPKDDLLNFLLRLITLFYLFSEVYILWLNTESGEVRPLLVKSEMTAGNLIN